MTAYDVVGDIHGHAEQLETLLDRLGYQRRHGAWGHPDRHMVFLGDFIDRGPDQVGAVLTVRSMIDAGNASAVSGNHENNAIGFATKGENGRWLRIRGSKNIHQHKAFLDAVGCDSDLHKEIVDWFRTLPLWLDLPGFRAIHACWHPGMQTELGPILLKGNRLPDNVDRFYAKGTAEYVASEVLLKGLEVPLPPEVVFRDEDGIERKNTRVRWWDETATDYRSAALVDDGVRNQLPEIRIDESCILSYDKQKPVFIGHYWMTGEPTLLSPHVACLDFSVAKGGYLTAYSFDGEAVLSRDKLTWVGSGPDPVIGMAAP